MVMRKMNRVFERHGRLVFAIITLLIIVSFVGLFTPGFQRSMSHIFGGNQFLAGHVFGEPVYQEQVAGQAVIEAIKISIRYDVANIRHPSITQMAERQAIRTMGMLAAAERMGIEASTKDIVDEARKNKAFQTNGGFDLKKYNDYIAKVLLPAGASAEDLDEALRQTVIAGKIYDTATRGIIVTPAEIRSYFDAKNQEFEIQSAEFDYNDLLEEVEVGNDEIESFYNLNRDNYKLPEKFNTLVAVFDYDPHRGRAAKEVTDTEIAEYYTRNKAELDKANNSLLAEDADKRFNAMFGITDLSGKMDRLGKEDDFTLAEMENAIKLNELRSVEPGGMAPSIKLAATEKLVDEKARDGALRAARLFAVDAYKKCLDENSARQTAMFIAETEANPEAEMVKTGWFSGDADIVPGIGREPELVTAIDRIFIKTPVSDAVAGRNAALVAFLLEREPSRIAGLEEKRDEISKDLKKEKALKIAREKARAAALEIEGGLEKGKSFDQAKGNTKFKDVPSFSGRWAPVANGQIIAELAAETPEDAISKTVDTPNGALFIHVSKRQAPSAEDFKKASGDITKEYENLRKSAAAAALFDWIESNTVLKNGERDI